MYKVSCFAHPAVSGQNERDHAQVGEQRADEIGLLVDI